MKIATCMNGKEESKKGNLFYNSALSFWEMTYTLNPTHSLIYGTTDYELASLKRTVSWDVIKLY
jgi:hypothetical protein